MKPNQSVIHFPPWVKVTACKTQSMTMTLPATNGKGYVYSRHGAMKWIRTWPSNRPPYWMDKTERVY